jgi:uncharacterized repeat protein (TIGR04138 family)
MAPTVQSDAPCKYCGYNLRTLPFDHRCPECGRFVYESTRCEIKLQKPATEAQAQAQKRLLGGLETVADDTGYPIRTVRLVWCATQYAQMITEGAPSPVSARDVCAALKGYALVHFGGENNAIIELAQHKIRASEDVGSIVYGMVRANILRESEGDSISDFDRLFTLGNLYNTDPE